MTRLLVAALACTVGASCTSTADPPSPAVAPFEWQLPRGIPPPRVPPHNPMTAAKVDLGRRLFYDTRLSGNGSFACATCHQQALAFTDGRPRAIGSTNQLHA